MAATPDFLGGIWHAQLGLLEHNFSEPPLAGIAVMARATIGIGPVYTEIMVRTDSVVAPTVVVGTGNGLGSLSFGSLVGDSAVLISSVGLALLVAGVGETAPCLARHRLIASTRITDGSGLVPWKGIATDT